MNARIAVVGDFHAGNPTHALTNAALDHIGLGFDWVPTDSIENDPRGAWEAFTGCG